jgi:hypothetical protein
MRFSIVRPCEHCPFRNDQPPFLSRERAEQIARTLRSSDAAWFACHETTGVKDGTKIPPENQSQTPVRE